MSGAKPSGDPGKEPVHRCGFVVCLGRTNVGKSSLLNRLLGQKVHIVSKKPQTTRRRMKGILNIPGAQIILVDTPGLHGVEGLLNAALERETLKAVEGADCICAITDHQVKESAAIEEKLLAIVGRSRRPSVLLLNKGDLLDGEKARRLADGYRQRDMFSTVLVTSAQTGMNIDHVPELLARHLPHGPPLYPDDIISDHPERDFFVEIVREKIFRTVHHEMPYSAAVVIDEVREDDRTGLYRVAATIYVERDSQKGILIGQGGKVLKKIGTDARRDMERLTGGKVHISLWVKVRKNWTKDPRSLREFGFSGAR